MTYYCGSHIVTLTPSSAVWSVFGEAHLISQFLTVRDTLSVSGTCKLLQNYYDKQIEILRVADECEDETYLQNLCLRLSRVNTIDFLNSRYHNWKPSVFSSLGYLTNVKHILALYIRVTDESSALRHFLKHATLLKSVDLSIYWGGVTEVNHILEPLHGLEHITLKILDRKGHDYFYILKLLNRCSSTLTTFSLEVNYQCVCTPTLCKCNFSDVLQYLLQKCTRLRSVEVSVPCLGKLIELATPNKTIMCLKISNAILDCIDASVLTTLERLETLHLDDSLSQNFVTALVKTLSSSDGLKLKRLSLTSTWKSTWSCRRDMSINSILKSLLQGPSKNTLTDFNLSGHFLCVGCVECLTTLAPRLSYLNVQNCATFTPVLNVTDLVTTAKNLLDLNISSWYLGDKEVSTLLIGVSHMRRIQTLNLSNNCVGDESIKVLPLVLKNVCATITSINIDFCLHTESDVERVWQIFSLCGPFKSLVSLRCKAWCNITSERCLNTLTLLLHVVPCLRTLSLSSPSDHLTDMFINIVTHAHSLSYLTVHTPYRDFIHERSEYLLHAIRRSLGSRRVQVCVN